ncbi:MAG: helix-turn-helix domain-containing protein [Acidobacteria bacterium]|nr:helix-turn-helix domain-containing protein [Acidobacteriota bacterium]
MVTGELLTINQTAEALNISPATVRAWRLRGKITIVKIGRAVRIPRSEIKRIIRQGLQPARVLNGQPEVA